MKNVLYVGNALSSKGKTVTPIETLSKNLGEFCNIKFASSKSNIGLRLLDMVYLVLKNKSKTDVVLIDTYSTLNFYYALVISFLCRILKIDYIPILHGGNLEHRLKDSPKLSEAIFKHAKCLVSPSKFLKSKFQDYSYDNVVFIPNSIDIENYNFKIRLIGTLKLLWVRSFSEIYNPQLAILVLENLIEKGHKATLTMVGPDNDGSLAKTKQLAKEKNLEVKFTGKLEKKEWIELSKEYNVFLNTTNFDNMPVSLIEAMALGLPIVSTNVGGIPFLIEDGKNGILVKADDVEEMVSAIIKLAKNESLKENIVHQARQKSESFDWKNIRSKWKALLS